MLVQASIMKGVVRIVHARTSVDHCPSAIQCATLRPLKSFSARLAPFFVSFTNRSAFPCEGRNTQLNAGPSSNS